MNDLEMKLVPGGASQLGFLGETESLLEVIEHDTRVLSELGLNHAEVATALEHVLSAVKDARRELLATAKGPDSEYFKRDYTRWFDPYDFESLSKLSFANLPSRDQGYLLGRHHIFVCAYRGLQECPWGCDLGSSSYDSCLNLLVLDRNTRDFFTFPGLSPHLIRAHHFFEGLQTPFRTDPTRVALVLGLRGANQG